MFNLNQLNNNFKNCLSFLEHFNVLLLMLIGTFMAWEIQKKGNEISVLYEAVYQHYPQHCQINKGNRRYDLKRKAVISMIILGAFNTIFFLLFSFAIANKFKAHYNLDATNTWLVALSVIIIWSTFYNSQLVFYLTFGECILVLNNWIVSLKDNFDENSHELLQNAQELCNCLKMTSKLFSRCNFYGMLIWLVNLILIAYKITSLLFSDEKDVIYALAYVFMALQHSLCVHNLNCSSQSMIDFVQVLGKTIKNTNMNDMKVEWKVEINFVLLKIYKNIRALKTLYVKQLSK